MNSGPMTLQVMFATERALAATVRTYKWLCSLRVVCIHMSLEVKGTCKGPVAIRALMRPTGASVGLCVRRPDGEDSGNSRCRVLARKAKIVWRNTEVRLTRLGRTIVRHCLGYAHGRGG